MPAAKSFFCAKFAQCKDHRDDCTEYRDRPKKVSRKGNKIVVNFK